MERSDNDHNHVKKTRVYLFQVPVKIHTIFTETFHFLIFSFDHRSLTVCLPWDWNLYPKQTNRQVTSICRWSLDFFLQVLNIGCLSNFKKNIYLWPFFKKHLRCFENKGRKWRKTLGWSGIPLAYQTGSGHFLFPFFIIGRFLKTSLLVLTNSLNISRLAD